LDEEESKVQTFNGIQKYGVRRRARVADIKSPRRGVEKVNIGGTRKEKVARSGKGDPKGDQVRGGRSAKVGRTYRLGEL
jgi:hypothetical protein